MRNVDRSVGAYLGAAIGDAMGGPVECNHAARIRRLHGEIAGLLPYQRPLTLIDLQPGYALHADPGCVTDDTFIRAEMTRFFLATSPPRTPRMLADWLLANADFDHYFSEAVEVLHRIGRGELEAESAGLTVREGGGIGWWTPIGILHAGNPKEAVREARNLCRIWKGPLEEDLLAGVQAGVAEGHREDATAESVLEAVLDPCGPLATKLIERAAEIARSSENFDELVDRLYHNVLIGDAPTGADEPMPPSLEPVADTDEPYAEWFFAEQVPLAVAAFVFEDGSPAAIPCACMIGRDADSVATSVGSWVGALHGESGLPSEWVEAVCRANMRELDLRSLAEQISALPA